MHHIFNVTDNITFNALVWTELKKHGIKETGRWRKPTRNNDPQKKSLFCQPLELLESEEALIMVESELENIPDGSTPICAKGDILVQVPTFVVQSCQAILKGVQTEGLFRKAGSACRQREIKRQLERKEGFKSSHDVIDLANILKQFLRELPDPLIPYQLHDILLKCVQMESLEKASQMLHLTCLLIPQPALATLCYLLQFFEAVAANSSTNLMDASNISIVMAPTLMPVHIAASSRNDRQNCSKLQNSAKVIQMLIENSSKLCGIPHSIASRLVSISSTSLVDQDRGRRNSRSKSRHRRSSSFNRVFEGLRKIVGAKSEFSASVEHLSDCRSESAADLVTPISPVIRSTFKRKVDIDINSGFAIKKKKAAGEGLSNGKVLCTTPLTPQGNHRYVIQTDNHHSYFASPRIDLNPSPSGPTVNSESNRSSVGVLRFFHRKKIAGRNEESNPAHPVMKTPKLTKRRLSLGKKNSKKHLVVEKKCELDEKPIATSPPCDAETVAKDSKKLLTPSPVRHVEEEDYVAMHQHYEELKIHVTSLEKEVVQKNLQSLSPDLDAKGQKVFLALEVQDQYEKTLEESDKLLLERSASEELARQLSRGLRIRKSAEQRVIRSPSARKIGAIRRRSRESPRANSSDSNTSGSSRRLTRSQSMLAIRRNPSILVQQMITPKRLIEPIHPSTHEAKISLRRGKPNTIRTGLKDPTPMRAQSISQSNNKKSAEMPLDNETPRISRLRTVPHPNTLAIEDSVNVPRHCVTRNGSVLKLAQNFTAITQNEITVASIPLGSPVSLADTAVLVTPEGCQQWSSGEVLNRHLDHLKIPLTGRPSVQKIRSENIGKVSAHVRKFDRLASPTLPDARCAALNPGVTGSSTETTPLILRSPRKRPSIQRQLSDPQVIKDRSTPPKTPQVSPLRESQRANALPLSSKGNDRYDLKIKAPLLTPNHGTHGTNTPFGLKLRGTEMKHTRIHKKPSPLKATGPLLRRSPRFTPSN